MPFLPYGRQSIDEEDIAAVTAVLRGDWLTTGPSVARFETALAETCGAEHAVACANGTAALHLAAMAAGLGPGDKAIVPSVTFLATANAVHYVGAEVVFADCDANSGLMEAKHFAAALERAGPGVKRAPRATSALRAAGFFAHSPGHISGSSFIQRQPTHEMP